MNYTENLQINNLINSHGGLLDFRDLVIIETSNYTDANAAKKRMRERLQERVISNYKRIK